MLLSFYSFFLNVHLVLRLIALWNTSFWKINRLKIFFFFFVELSCKKMCRTSPFTCSTCTCFRISLFVLPSWQKKKESSESSCLSTLRLPPPSLASHTHPHAHSHSLQVHGRTQFHIPLFPSQSSAALSSRYIVQAVAMETGAAAEWQTRECVFYSSVVVCVCVCAVMNANVPLCVSPFVAACVWPGCLISPALCAACHDARTRLDVVYQHQPHGFALLHHLPWPPFSFNQPPLWLQCWASKLEPFRNLARCSLEMAEREICCCGLCSHSVCSQRVRGN